MHIDKFIIKRGITVGEKIKVDEAFAKLNELRSGRGRTSKYAEYLEEVDNLKKGEAYSDVVNGYNEVSGLRNYLDRSRPEQYEVKAVKHPDDKGKDQNEAKYNVFVFHQEDVEE